MAQAAVHNYTTFDIYRTLHRTRPTWVSRSMQSSGAGNLSCPHLHSMIIATKRSNRVANCKCGTAGAVPDEKKKKNKTKERRRCRDDNKRKPSAHLDVVDAPREDGVRSRLFERAPEAHHVAGHQRRRRWRRDAASAALRRPGKAHARRAVHVCVAIVTKKNNHDQQMQAN